MGLIQQIRHTPFNRSYATFILVIMSIQLVPVEGFGTSPIKIGLMGLSLLVFLFRVPYLTRAFWACMLYWLTCLGVSLMQSYIRFNTLGYLGLFLITYITYYNLVYSGAFALGQFKKLLRDLLLAFTVFLILQQIFVLVGITYFPPLNLNGNLLGPGNIYYQWNRLPSLTCEPSHTARVITATMLGYIRCLEMEKGKNITLKNLFDKDNRLVTLAYLWLVFTTGSGTAWIGLAILCLYFIRWRTFIYIIPLILVGFLMLQYSGNEQLDRAVKTAQATLTGEVMEIQKADGSASYRVIPLINTILYTDLSDRRSWIGKGTLDEDDAENAWLDLTRKVSTVEQYGLLGLIASLILFYSCAVRRVFSIETLLLIFLLTLSLNNIYIVWSMMFIFTTVRYFQMQQERAKNRNKIVAS